MPDIKNWLKRKTNLVMGSVFRNSVKAYWWDYVDNFGDLLVPMLLKEYGLIPIHTPKPLSDVICIGSILQSLNDDYDGYIVGCGLINDVNKQFPNAKILALRGKLTRDRLGAPEDTVLGDPGLLIDKFRIRRQARRYVIGLVPHFKDKNDERLQIIYQRFPKDVLIIDVQRKPKDVIMDIDKCHFILSSSLHGIVTADSLGIPNAWMLLSEKASGSGFKFYDYASAFGMKKRTRIFNRQRRFIRLKGHDSSSIIANCQCENQA